ncbi:histidyl-tRNA synthetase, putative [Plasmodium vivax]|uniref:histidine--tRNA ligase n=1 Tax=Plasmodium vivax (strain Salvador I) TaxID=126793 RepID=A5KEA5_PLAVS|nr:histidyl-tRNA synthetase, putative [Plasmodium vivax]EDL42323.1 histidyl-tRNA synthetase, putative [Plasmodium vivax]|eukprot:XP_001608347.1 histidyl-tRNA synthetase [Plasmodium vivax Sal-1]
MLAGLAGLTRLALAAATLLQVRSMRTGGQGRRSSPPWPFLTTPWATKSTPHHKRSTGNKNISLKSVRGIRTFNPRDYARREYIFKTWEEVAKAFSFSFYDLPVLEDYHIFQRSKINEAYDFVKNKRHLILRPEITPQLVSHLFVREERARQAVRQDGGDAGDAGDAGEEGEAGQAGQAAGQSSGQEGGQPPPPQSGVATDRSHSSHCSHRARVKPYRLHNLRRVHKMSTIGQCFRYERTTSCRKREHYQWNMDVIGTDLIDADVEILTALLSFFRRVHLLPSDVVIKINDKRVVIQIIKKIFKSSLREFPQPYIQHHAVPNVLQILDKHKKISSGTFKLLLQRKVPYLHRHEVVRFFNVIWKVKNLPDLFIFFNSPEQNILSDLHTVLRYFGEMNLQSFFEVDLTVVRGMDYYTNIIFESFYRHKKYRAICGGGRYSYVLNEGQRVCAVGFGMGDVVITEILFNSQVRRGRGSEGDLPDELSRNVDVVSFFPPLAQRQGERQVHRQSECQAECQSWQKQVGHPPRGLIQREHFHIVDTLRGNGARVYSLLQGGSGGNRGNRGSLSKALKKANALRANFFLFFDEHIGVFFLKDLRTGGQRAVTSADVLSVYSSGVSPPQQ